MPYTSWEREDLDDVTATFDDTAIATLANNVAVLSSEIDNSAGAWTHADFELSVDFGTAPTGPVELYAVTAFDGTNYIETTLTATYVVGSGCRIGAFSPRGVTTAQKCILRDVPIPAAKFKLLLGNKGGFAFDGSGKYLKMWRKRLKLNP